MGNDHQQHRSAVERLCEQAFSPDPPIVGALTDVNEGRGAFSVVLRAELGWPASGGDGRPSSVVAKLPVDGPNRAAAAASGAYEREALAYRELLAASPIAAPTCYAIDEPGDGTCSLLLEDLTAHRVVDQLDGLGTEDGATVAADLARFHRAWADDDRLAGINVRRNTIAALPDAGLAAGLAALDSRWAGALSAAKRDRYRRLAAGRERLAVRFAAERPTLCHGDPRADNLVFAIDGRTVLFDWQQMAVQFAEADLAWLCATSLEPDVRRAGESTILAAADADVDRYRLGLALPGLTVLLLAQRELVNERAERFVATSLARIADALDDHDVDGLAG